MVHALHSPAVRPEKSQLCFTVRWFNGRAKPVMIAPEEVHHQPLWLG